MPPRRHTEARPRSSGFFLIVRNLDPCLCIACEVVTSWDASFESTCRALIVTIVEDPATQRAAAWQSLLVRVSPHVEKWASQSRLLRRWRLTSPDEAREVLVLVIERLMRDDYRNLRAFLERPGRAPERAHGDADSIAALSSLLDIAEQPDETSKDDVTGTPLRAWLKRLVEYVIRDHLYARLGRADSKRAAEGRTKRDLHTDAKPIAPSDIGVVRPPMTDVLTLRKIAEAVEAYAEQRLTPQQWQAVRMRRDDASFPEIAEALALASPDDARKLVRSGIERLRSHFHARWDELHGT